MGRKETFTRVYMMNTCLYTYISFGVCVRSHGTLSFPLSLPLSFFLSLFLPRLSLFFSFILFCCLVLSEKKSIMSLTSSFLEVEGATWCIGHCHGSLGFTK